MPTITEDFSKQIHYKPMKKLWPASSWTWDQAPGASVPYVYDGKLRFTCMGGSHFGATAYSDICFRPFSDPDWALGDFSFSIEFSNAYLTENTAFVFRVNRTSEQIYIMREYATGGNQKITSITQPYGEASNTQSVITDTASGKLRIRRVGTTIYLDYDIGGGWVNLQSRTYASRPDVGALHLHGASYSGAGENMYAYVDNFSYTVANQTLYKIIGEVTPPSANRVYLVKNWDGYYPQIMDYTTVDSETGEFTFDNIWTNTETFDVIYESSSGERDLIYSDITPVAM